MTLFTEKLKVWLYFKKALARVGHRPQLVCTCSKCLSSGGQSWQAPYIGFWGVPVVLEQLPSAVTWIIPLYIGFFSFSFSTCFLLLLLLRCSVASDSLWPHGLQHTRLPCPSTSPRACSNSCPLSQWYHPTVLSSVLPFSCLQSFPASGSACRVGDLG